ncbi:MAG: hypothetical protein ACRCYU_24270, partial [Nocardioides sp.]
ATSELASLDEVEGEVSKVAASIEETNTMLADLKGWAAMLPDRWSSTSWATRDLDSAIDGVGDAASAVKLLDELHEALNGVLNACRSARSITEVVESHGAKGDVDAFKAA